MKKIIIVALAALMSVSLLSLTGCSSEEKVLKVALSPDFAPMEFVDTSKSGMDQYVGFDVTLAKYIAEKLGMTLEIMPMSFDACQVAVSSGNVDMSISGFSKTDERAKNYNLSDFYYAGDNETQQSIIVLKDKEGKFSKAEDFAGLKVGAQTASLQRDLVGSQLPESVECVEFTDIGTAVEALRNGNIDALAVAHGNGEAIITNNDAIAFSGFDFEVSEEQSNNVILLQKGNDELTEKVNGVLAEAYAAGLYGGWYADAKELAGIASAQEVEYDDAGKVAD